jgi:riboflavin biosynthesis pyrimidine reductase
MDPLTTLFDEADGDPLPLPPELLAVYGGPLRMPARRDRPHVFANFVATLDGIVAIDPPRGSGAEISGGHAQDRAVMGILRAAADAVIVGSGNLRAESAHVWTAETICPELAPEYGRFRAALGKPPAPLQVIVSGSGDVDLSRPVFSGAVPAMVVTTAAGAAVLRRRGASVRIVVPEGGPGWIPLAAVLAAAGLGPAALVLVESGPTATTHYYAEGAVDELFLTRSPFLVGRAAPPLPPTLGLVQGRVFRPGARAGRLVSARRSGDFLMLRYALRGS